MDFINEQVLAAYLGKGISKFHQAMAGKIEIFRLHIEGFLLRQLFFDMLEHQCCLAYAHWPHETYHANVPIDTIVQIAME